VRERGRGGRGKHPRAYEEAKLSPGKLESPELPRRGGWETGWMGREEKNEGDGRGSQRWFDKGERGQGVEGKGRAKEGRRKGHKHTVGVAVSENATFRGRGRSPNLGRRRRTEPGAAAELVLIFFGHPVVPLSWNSDG
jgi:hypothetical protein